MKTGKVKFFNETKGFGFIVDDESGKDVFVHATGLKDQVKPNDKVEYDLRDEKRGPSAVDVRVLG